MGDSTVVIPRSDDFDLTGDGNEAAWQAAPWLPLTRVGGTTNYQTRAKAMYSATGLYFMLDCQDEILTCKQREDFEDLYLDDVFEVFLWPDERQDLYFEYELSPLGAELPILVANRGGTFFGWRPWHYEGARVARRKTSVRGGKATPGAAVTGWTAECFIPFELFRGFASKPPAAGDRWRMNLYRIDYDRGAITQWAWCPATSTNFHDYRNFGSVIFGG